MFNERLREMRISRGYTQKTMADSINVAVRTYQNYEGGTRTPSYETLAILSNILDVSIDYLLGETDDNTTTVHIPNIKPIVSNKTTIKIKIDDDTLSKLNKIAHSELRTLDAQVEYFLLQGIRSYEVQNGIIETD